MPATTGPVEPRRRGRPPAGRREETLDRILRAARVSFSRRGFARTSMADIAARADVTARALYHYVESKNELFALAAERSFDRFLTALDRLVFVHDDARTRMHGYVDVFRDLYKEDPSLVAFVSIAAVEVARLPELTVALPPGVFSAGGPHTRIVADAAARGELAPGIDPAGAVALLDVFASGLTMVAHPDRDAEYLAMLDAMEQVLEGSLLVSPTARPAGPPPPGGGPAR